jgi:hypothetical protein
VAYVDITTNRFEYSYSANGINWSTPFATSSSANVGHGADIRISPNNKPVVSYYDPTANTVYYAQCTHVINASDVANNCSVSWQFTGIEFAVSGWGLSAAKNSVGGLVSAFVGPENWLYSTSCGD